MRRRSPFTPSSGFLWFCLLVLLLLAGRAAPALASGKHPFPDELLAPTISIEGYVEKVEGNATPNTYVFVVSLSEPSSSSISVDYATSDITALAGDDYFETSATLVFPPQSTTRNIYVDVIGDTLDEETEEEFQVTLSNPVNASILTGTGVGKIIDDDPPPTVSISDSSISEGNTGSKQVTLNVTLSTHSGRQIQVEYSTADGEALAGQDYTATSGLLTFEPGETAQTVTVITLGDFIDEDLETFVVNLTDPLNVLLGKASGVISILDDDTAGISVTPTSGLVTSESGDSAQFSVVLTSQPRANLTIPVSSSDPGEGSASVSALVFTPAQWNQPKTVTVTGVDDDIQDGDQPYSIILGIAGTGGQDPKFDGMNPPDVQVTNINNDGGPIYMAGIFQNYRTPIYHIETFTNPDVINAWTIYTNQGGSHFVQGEEYHLRHTTQNNNIKSIAPYGNLTYAYLLEVKAHLVDVSRPDARYGLIFDFLDNSHLYRFIIRPANGEFRVDRFDPAVVGNWVALPGGYGVSDAVKSGTQVNVLRLERRGAQLRIFVNDVELTAVPLDDGEYQFGSVGLLLIAPETMPFGSFGEAAFDDFVIQQLYE